MPSFAAQRHLAQSLPHGSAAMAHGVKRGIADGDRFLPIRAVSLANRLFHRHRPGIKKFAPQNCSMERTRSGISLKAGLAGWADRDHLWAFQRERAAAFLPRRRRSSGDFLERGGPIAAMS
jgi:hypothetical protein